MKESEKLKQEAQQEDNDLKALGLHIKSARAKRGEDFKEEYLPTLLKLGFYIETDDAFTKYSINTNELGFGIVDFFPKKNKLLIRATNSWVNGGREWIKQKLMDCYD